VVSFKAGKSGEYRYGRTLGEIILNGESVNVWLVRGGSAW